MQLTLKRWAFWRFFDCLYHTGPERDLFFWQIPVTPYIIRNYGKHKNTFKMSNIQKICYCIQTNTTKIRSQHFQQVIHNWGPTVTQRAARPLSAQMPCADWKQRDACLSGQNFPAVIEYCRRKLLNCRFLPQMRRTCC